MLMPEQTAPCPLFRHRPSLSSQQPETFMINPYREEERLEAMVSACYRATRSHFNHLPLKFIIAPPTHLMDAKLARQIGIVLLRCEFNVPRKRISKLLEIHRASVIQAIRTVERRRLEPMFDRAYERIASRAQDLFKTAMYEAAEQDVA